MTWNRTIIAGAVLVAMFLLAVLDRQIIVNRVYDAVNAHSLAAGVDASSVKEIRLKNPEGEAVLVREGENGWKLKSPMEAPADPEVVETLLINVTAANRTNEIDPPSLTEYGLVKPETEVTFVHTSKDQKEKEFSLQLGNASTYTGLVFAKYPGEKTVFTIGQHVKSVLSRGPRDFRRSRLFDIDIANLNDYKTITLKDRTQEVVLRNEAGKWRITSPFQARAESEIVSDYLRKVGLLRASSFLTEKSDRPTSVAAALEALTSPSLVASFEKAGEAQPQTLSVATADGSAGPVVVARRGNDTELLALRSETLEDLRRDAHFFRTRNVFGLEPKDVGALKVRIGHALTDLVRNEKGLWELRGQPGLTVDQEGVEGRLEALLKTRVLNFIDPNPTNPGDYDIPLFSFTVASKDGSRTETLETGKFERATNSSYARRSGDPAVFTTEISKDLIITPDQVTDRHFARVNPELVKKIELESGGQKFVLKLEDGEWKREREGQPGIATVDKRLMDRFFLLLNGLEYERDLSATGDRVITPPAEDAAVVTVFGSGEEPVVKLTTGRRLAERTYLTVDSGRTVEVRNAEVDRLRLVIGSLQQ